MKHFHPVFNVVKLTLAFADPIPGRHPPPPPLPEIIDGELKWVVEEILDSKLINRKLRYLIKWKDFGIEHNTWEPWDNVHAPELVTEFYRKHPGAARHIRATEFSSIPFQSLPVPRRHFLEGGMDVRGHHVPVNPTDHLSCGSIKSHDPADLSTRRPVNPRLHAYPRYIIPQRRLTPKQNI